MQSQSSKPLNCCRASRSMATINFANGVDVVKEAILNALPQLRLYLWALEQVNKLAGNIDDSQAGNRNFGSNYAAQEKALFEQAGGWTPYSNNPQNLTLQNITTTGGGGGGNSAASEAALAGRTSSKAKKQRKICR